MKMQNAEMEFVAFDANDVITTSGELTAWFKVSSSLYNNDGFDYRPFDNDVVWVFGNWDQYQYLFVDQWGIDGQYITLTAGKSSYTGSIGKGEDLKITGATKNGSRAGEELKSLEEIVTWLNANGVGAQ